VLDQVLLNAPPAPPGSLGREAQHMLFYSEL
jgi:hypothetical protein